MEYHYHLLSTYVSGMELSTLGILLHLILTNTMRKITSDHQM